MSMVSNAVNTTESEECKAARSFFRLLRGSRKNISDKEFVFFLNYYNVKGTEIYEEIKRMLRKEFKANIMIAGEKIDTDSRFSTPPSPFKRYGLFQMSSLVALKQCYAHFLACGASPFLSAQYPGLAGSFYDFWFSQNSDLSSCQIAWSSFYELVRYDAEEDAAHGEEFRKLTALLGRWQSLIQSYTDLTDNFDAFKVLVKYPRYIPYIYLSERIDNKFLLNLLNSLDCKNEFRDVCDFVTRFIAPTAPCFSFALSAKLSKMVAQVPDRLINMAAVSKMLPLSGEGDTKLPFPVKVLGAITQLPVYLAQFAFELFGFITYCCQRLYWVAGISLVFGLPRLIEQLSDDPLPIRLTFPVCIKLLFSNELAAGVTTTITNNIGTAQANTAGQISATFLYIFGFSMFFLLLPILFSVFLHDIGRKINSKIDFVGYRLTFADIHVSGRRKLSQFVDDFGSHAYLKLLPQAIISVVFIAAVVAAVIYLCAAI